MLAINCLSAQEYCNFQEWTTTKGVIDRTTDNIDLLPPQLAALQVKLGEQIQFIDDLDNIYMTMPEFDEASETYKMLVRRINASGEEVWSNQYEIPEANGNVIPNTIKMDKDGNLLVAGTYQFAAPLNYDGFLIKINSLGAVMWLKSYTGVANGFDGWLDLTTDEVGNIYLAGATTPQGLTPDFTVKGVDTNGQDLWQKQLNPYNRIDVATQIKYLNGVVFTTGITQQDTDAYGLLNASYTSTDGGVIFETPTFPVNTQIYQVEKLIGDSDDEVVHVVGTVRNAANADFYLAKVNMLTGLVIWQAGNPSNGLGDARARSAVKDANDNVFVAGYMKAQNTGRDFAVVKYNPLGVALWTKFYDGAGLNDEAHDIAIDGAGNLYLTGYGIEHADNKDFLTIKTDNDGNELWRKTYNGIHNGEDIAKTIRLDNTGGVVVGGPTDEGELVRHTVVKYGDECTVELPQTEAFSSSIAFIENRGQLLNTDGEAVQDIKYKSDVVSPTHYFFDNQVSLVLVSDDGDDTTPDQGHRVDMKLNAATDRSRGIYPLEKRSDYYNYYLGHIPEGRARVPLYKNLVHRNAFPNIDVQYAGKTSGMAYSFIVKPSGNPSDISLKFSGQDGLSVNSDGELVIATSVGDIVLPEARAYQIGGNGEAVYLSWTPNYTISDNEVGFEVGNYDLSGELVIEVRNTPPDGGGGPDDNNDWTTYYGGDGQDEDFTDVKSDFLNDIYVTGFSEATNFPAGGGTIMPVGETDAFLLKFDDSAVRKFATFFGGTDFEFARALEVSGFLGSNTVRITVVGRTDSSNFPTLDNDVAEFSGVNSSGTAAFFTRFDANGIVKHSSYYNGSANGGLNIFHSITTDSEGNRWIVGTGNVPNIGNNSTTIGTGLILQLNSSFQIEYSSNYGHTEGVTVLKDVIVDSNDDAFFVGWTSVPLGDYDFPNSQFPIVPNPAQSGNIYAFDFLNDAVFSNTIDGVVGKIKSSNKELLWSTPFLGFGNDVFEAVNVNSKDEVYIVGNTSSNDVGLTTPQPPNFDEETMLHNGPGIEGENDDQDGYIAKVSNVGEIIWATYFGSPGEDAIRDIEIDDFDNVYVIGSSNELFSDDPLPFDSYYQKDSPSGFFDAFILSFADDAKKRWITYFGGSDNESGKASHITNDNSLYLTGSFSASLELSDDFPLVDFDGESADESYFQNTFETDNNQVVIGGGYIARFRLDNLTNTSEIQDEKSYQSLKAYPNPVSDAYQIGLPNGDSQEVIARIFSAHGQLIEKRNLGIDANQQISLNAGHLLNGTYYLEISSLEEQRIGFIKLIVQR